jgi:predicted nucleotidyltransferase
VLSRSDPAHDLKVHPRVQHYLDELVETCASIEQRPVSVILFGSAASGGFSGGSDVDLLIVVADDSTPEDRRKLRAAVERLEALHGFCSAHPTGALQARIERAVGHLASCFMCTRSDLISGDVARILDLRSWETPFVDRIVLAGIVASAVTAWGEDLLPSIPVPPVRRFDVFKALFGFSCQVILSAEVFPVLPDATKYAMGALKHSLHSCFFCYQGRMADLEEEVAFFNRRLGGSRTLAELVSLRRQYHKSFGFVMRCLPTLVRLHIRTAWDSSFAH